MPTANLVVSYRVSSISESGADRVTVNFVQDEANGQASYVPTPTPYGNGNVSLNLPASDGAAYFPGQKYNVTFAPAPTAV